MKDVMEPSLTQSTRQHPLGFREIWPKPTPEELARHYNQAYYGADRGQYATSYSEEELQNKQWQCAETALLAGSVASKRLLELGCGEGFVLDYFDRLGWTVSGIDFTLDGVRRFFPHLIDRVETGDLFACMATRIQAGERYNLITCTNVLEHVVDPQQLLQDLRQLLAPGGLVKLVVPNDESPLHHALVRQGMARPDFWVCPPDHLNYFNRQTLSALLQAEGFVIREWLGDFPIGLFLFNPDSNYQQGDGVDKSRKGKNCHQARTRIENLLADEGQNGMTRWLAFRRGCGAAEVCRNFVVYLQMES